MSESVSQTWFDDIMNFAESIIGRHSTLFNQLLEWISMEEKTQFCLNPWIRWNFSYFFTSDSMQMDSKNLNEWMEVIIYNIFCFLIILNVSCSSDMFVMIYVTAINPICPTSDEHKPNLSLHKRTHENTHHICLKTLYKLPGKSSSNVICVLYVGLSWWQ